MSDGWRGSASLRVGGGISLKVRNQGCQPFAPIAWLGVSDLGTSISDNHKGNVWDKVKDKHDDFEEAQEKVNRKMEGIFRNRNLFIVYSKKPITGKPYQKGRQNQQSSIDNGAPLEKCSNYVVIHNHYSFCFLGLTRMERTGKP
jgi:hypothetical protein